MPIITISRGSYSKGKEIAEKVAGRLGYVCLSRGLLQREAAETYQIPEVALVRAIHDAPTILERLGHKKEKYVACYRAVVLKHLQQDNVVYHGLAGHFLARGIPHALKVRIVADLADRVRWEMERENISEKEAMRVLQADDERAKWSKYLYGIDTRDPQSYDMVLRIRKLSVDDAVAIICHAASLPAFHATEPSRQKANDLAVAASVSAALIDFQPDVEVTCDRGEVSVKTTASLSQEDPLVQQIKEIAATVPGVKGVRVSPPSNNAHASGGNSL